MAYAHRPDIYDADTHMMELPDWVASFADPKIRPLLAPFVDGHAESLRNIDDAIAKFARRRADGAHAAEIERTFMSLAHKGWHSVGAFDAAERRRAIDLLGFKACLVFPTEAFDQVVAARDPEILVGGVRAMNRGMMAFCAADKRNIGTAYIPLGAGAQTALMLVDEAVAGGFRVLLIDTAAPKDGLSFTHPDYDRVWARIQDADLAIALHLGVNGGSFNPVPGSFYSNGGSIRRPADGASPHDALSFMAVHYSAELFLSAMIFDGVLERFPRLRIAVVETGASWLVSWMKQLDLSFRIFRDFQDMSHLKLLPSDYVRRQIKATPVPDEDIGWMISTGIEDLLMFGSDYPHPEGTDDPIGRFEVTMSGVSEAARGKFYGANFRAFIGSGLPG